jgi:HAD superfamily hydrolase (TIGR01490 family)
MEQTSAAFRGVSDAQLDAEAAIFDLDRTLIPGSSSALLAGMMVRSGLVPKWALTRQALRAAAFPRYGISDAGLGRLEDAGLAAVRGLPHRPLLEMAARAGPRVAATTYPGARWLLDQHRRAGHFCVLLSAAPQELVEAVGAILGVHRCVGTRTLVHDGRLTGALDGPLCHGAGKLFRLREELGPVDLSRAAAYGDSGGDIALLEATARPVAVRPDRRLRAHALAAGWPIIRFT